MALSEHEQRLLDEMERNFYRSDAEFAASSTGPRRVDYTSVTIGALVIVVGIGLAVGGVASQMWWLGVVGFVVMFGGALLTLRRKPVPGADPFVDEARTSRSGGDFMSAFERRWERRQDGRDGGG